MEVTKQNFKDCLVEITKDIEEANFISFDGEFTGLTSERNILPFDTSQEYYEKYLRSTKGFILIQLGISLFKKDPGGEKVKVKSYNIYTFPQSNLATFLCQGHSVSFLAENGFDFNKLFSSGVGFCNEKEEERLRQEVNERQEFRKEQIKIRTSEEQADTSSSSRIFLPVPDNERELIDNAKEKIQQVLDNKILEVKFEKLNGFQRKLMYELIERDFNNKISTLTKNGENNQKIMIITTKRTLEEEMKLEKEKIRDEENSLTEKIGIRLIMKEISKSKKPVVAHNCLLDFFYILTQCFEDLPEDYNEFKKLIHRLFPNIIDTKFITNSEHFKEFFSSTVLNQILERLQKPPFKEIKLEWENPYNIYSLKSPKEHEAGYDSFLTGYCFLALLDHLNVPLESNFEKSKALAPFLNRIALQRITQPYIYITGDEPKFSRTHVFHIKFPQSWQAADIHDHFKNYGPVQISWVDSSTAFVQLYNRENSSCVVKTIGKVNGFEIKSFAEFQIENVKQRAIKRKNGDSDSESTKLNSTPTKPDAKRKKKKDTFKECNNW